MSETVYTKWLTLPAAAAHAHSVRALRSHGFPPVVRLLLFLPALRLLPGQRPAHELKCLAEGNCFMSAPVSAKMLAALRSWIPGTVCINCQAWSRPASRI